MTLNTRAHTRGTEQSEVYTVLQLVLSKPTWLTETTLSTANTPLFSLSLYFHFSTFRFFAQLLLSLYRWVLCQGLEVGGAQSIQELLLLAGLYSCDLFYVVKIDL